MTDKSVTLGIEGESQSYKVLEGALIAAQAEVHARRQYRWLPARPPHRSNRGA